MKAYQPARFPGRITLFKAITGSDKVELPADYGWSSHAGGGLQIIEIPGRHLTLFEPHHIGALANSLHLALSREETPDGKSPPFA